MDQSGSGRYPNSQQSNQISNILARNQSSFSKVDLDGPLCCHHVGGEVCVNGSPATCMICILLFILRISADGVCSHSSSNVFIIKPDVEPDYF